jgi:hypothetical protein
LTTIEASVVIETIVFQGDRKQNNDSLWEVLSPQVNVSLDSIHLLYGNDSRLIKIPPQSTVTPLQKDVTNSDLWN